MVKNIPALPHTQRKRGCWLMGALVLIPAILLPPRSFFYRLLIDTLNLKNLFPYLRNYYPMPSGLAGQLLYYTRLVRTNSVETGDFLMALVASCLATLSLMLFWRLLVDCMPRPTLLQVLLTALAAVGSSLVLTLILYFMEYSVSAPIVNKASQVWALILTTLILFIVQLLFAPFLFICGAILVKWQMRAESRAAT